MFLNLIKPTLRCLKKSEKELNITQIGNNKNSDCKCGYLLGKPITRETGIAKISSKMEKAILETIRIRTPERI